MRFAVLATSTLFALASAVPWSVGGDFGAGFGLGNANANGNANGNADGHMAAGVDASMSVGGALGLLQGLSGSVTQHCHSINSTLAGMSASASADAKGKAAMSIGVEMSGMAASISGVVGQIGAGMAVKGGLLSGGSFSAGMGINMGGDVSALVSAFAAIIMEISCTMKAAIAILGAGAMTASLQILGGALSGLALAMQFSVKGFLPAISASLGGVWGDLSAVMQGSIFSIAAGTFCL